MRETIDAASEFIFLGLRLNNGINLGEFRGRFNIDLIDEYGDRLKSLMDDGLIELDSETLKLTQKGMLFSNLVFQEFV